LKALNHDENLLLSMQFNGDTFGYLAFVGKYSLLKCFVAFKTQFLLLNIIVIRPRA
jgi:hypothetical protein